MARPQLGSGRQVAAAQQWCRSRRRHTDTDTDTDSIHVVARGPAAQPLPPAVHDARCRRRSMRKTWARQHALPGCAAVWRVGSRQRPAGERSPLQGAENGGAYACAN